MFQEFFQFNVVCKNINLWEDLASHKSNAPVSIIIMATCNQYVECVESN